MLKVFTENETHFVFLVVHKINKLASFLGNWLCKHTEQ